MRLDPRERRSLTLVALVLHLFVPGLVPVADGVLEAAHRSCPVSLAPAGDTHGGPVHNHELCPYCRILAAGFLWTPRLDRGAPVPITHLALHAPAPPALPRATVFSPVGARAPPAL